MTTAAQIILTNTVNRPISYGVRAQDSNGESIHWSGTLPENTAENILEEAPESIDLGTLELFAFDPQSSFEPSEWYNPSPDDLHYINLMRTLYINIIPSTETMTLTLRRVEPPERKPLDNFVIQRTLAQMPNSTVYLARDIGRNIDVALKKITKHPEGSWYYQRDRDLWVTETTILKQLKSLCGEQGPVVCLVDAFED